MIAQNRTNGRTVATRVRKADSPFSRAVGLLDRDGLEEGEGLWIVPCAMVHTFFMRFDLDLIFLDKDRRALRIVENLPPWRVSPWVWSARSVLELAGGTLRGSVRPGDLLEIQ